MTKVVILGYGGRGRNYGLLCNNIINKKRFEVVAVIDTQPDKLNLAKKEMNLADDKLFNNIDDFCAIPKMAKYMFICTQDKQHHEHAIKALNCGYNLLLEKPIATTLEDCVDIAKVANEKGLKVDVCHVLRYSEYYEKIKEKNMLNCLNKDIKFNYKRLNIKNGIKNNINAVYTIEMSLLFPIILFIVFGGVYIAFYTHDMTVTRAECNRCCNEAAGQGLAVSDFEKRIENVVRKRLILGTVKRVKVSKKEGYINVSIDLNYDMMFWKLKKTETINITVNEISNPDYLRKVQVIADELEKIIR